MRVLSDGVSCRYSTPVDHDAAAGVGALDAGDDLDQRRLAGSVLAGQAMHLAGGDREINPA